MNSNWNFKKFYNNISKKANDVKDGIYSTIKSNEIHLYGCYFTLLMFMYGVITIKTATIYANALNDVVKIISNGNFEAIKIISNGNFEAIKIISNRNLETIKTIINSKNSIIGEFLHTLLDKWQKKNE